MSSGQKYQLKVSVPNARNLTALDWGGASDPFAALFVSDAAQAKQTDVVDSDVNPVWQEKDFEFSDIMELEDLSVRVWNHNMITDDALGAIDINMADVMKQFVNKGTEPQWHNHANEPRKRGLIKGA